MCLMHVLLWRVYPVLKISRGWSLTYVLGATFVLGMLFNAMLKVVGATGTTWRGTKYRRREVDLGEGKGESPTVKKAVADG